MTDKIDSWDSFGSSFLKASDVININDFYIVINVLPIEKNGKEKVRLSLERNFIKKDFDLNNANINRIKGLGIASPKALLGKKIYFEKVMATNPQTKAEVPSLRICKIE